MNRTVQAVTAMATLAVAGAATAQGSVTLYGRADVSFDQVSIKSSTRSRSVTALSNDGSRFGMRGTRELGEGLTANFNVESGFAIDTGASTQGGVLFGRTAWVGLSSASLGDVRFGRNNIPMDDVAWEYDSFYAAGTGALWALQPYAARVNNSIKYISPTLGKIQFRGLVSAAEGVAGVGGEQFGVSAQYRDKPFDIAFAHTIVKDPTLTLSERKETYLGGALKFNGPRIVASIYQRNDQGAAKLSTSNIGGNLPLGGGDLRVSLTRTTQGVESTDQSSVGYWYPWLKHTFVYGAVSLQKNSANRNAAINPSFVVKANGDDIVATQIGIRHNF
jgi:GBP family porin